MAESESKLKLDADLKSGLSKINSCFENGKIENNSSFDANLGAEIEENVEPSMAEMKFTLALSQGSAPANTKKPQPLSRPSGNCTTVGNGENNKENLNSDMNTDDESDSAKMSFEANIAAKLETASKSDFPKINSCLESAKIENNHGFNANLGAEIEENVKQGMAEMKLTMALGKGSNNETSINVSANIDCFVNQAENVQQSNCMDEVVNDFSLAQVGHMTSDNSNEMSKSGTESDVQINKRLSKVTKKRARGKKRSCQDLRINEKRIRRQPERALRVRTSAEENEYEVERIVGYEKKEGEERFCVKWVGYDDCDNTWEPRANLNCDSKLEEFLRNRKTNTNALKRSRSNNENVVKNDDKPIVKSIMAMNKSYKESSNGSSKGTLQSSGNDSSQEMDLEGAGEGSSHCSTSVRNTRNNEEKDESSSKTEKNGEEEKSFSEAGGDGEEDEYSNKAQQDREDCESSSGAQKDGEDDEFSNKAEKDGEEEEKSSREAGSDGEEEYQVEDIMDYVKKGGEEYFLIKWVGYDESDNTWEPRDNLNCDSKLEEFFESRKTKVDVLALMNSLSLSEPTATELQEMFKKQYGKGRKVKLWQSKKLEREVQKLKILLDDKDGSKDQNEIDNKIQAVKIQLRFRFLQDKREAQQKELRKWSEEMSQADGCPVVVENLVDLEGAPAQITYIGERQASSSVNLEENPLVGCEACGPCCEFDRCLLCCPAMNDAKFAYNKSFRLRIAAGLGIFECNDLCKCGQICTNRVVQKGRKVRLGVYKTDNGCGWGVRAEQVIPKGEFVVEYVGSIVTTEEAADNHEDGMSYLFELDFYKPDCPLYTIDASSCGNVARFINHSCNPNLQVMNVWVNCMDLNLPRIAFFAARKIESGEPITFDYGFKFGFVKEGGDDGSDDERTQCLCKSNLCSEDVIDVKIMWVQSVLTAARPTLTQLTSFST